MKEWVMGRRLMDEQPAPDEGGGGGAGDEAQKGADASPAPGDGEEGDPAGGGEEERRNALGEELNKGEEQPGEKPKGDQPGEKAANPDEAPTEAETKAYRDAIRLDEDAFGKGQKFDERYVERLPALFKRHGIAPERANALANDFAKMQREVEKDAAEKLAKFREWREGELKKMNDAYHAEYDQAGRADIARAIVHFFPKGSPMFEAVCMTEVGVDPGFLKAMKFIGERLPKDAAPGAASGAGTGGGKSLSDSFMGL